ncbi:hypothetical protein [Prosthecomicrobium pneumaticum]|uniref:Uncharacterized protein n=1 Tax=Prosthecomicrobium pneumaticum TaxID=81895 RepID=A0A7W9FJ60_9HYPH|nr:hypothetical protein [Prosthecomicrobium pneumaticum]MBB5751180.1 hypothetical protein [Prosthecomicrobium pneumaticum]
MQTRLLFALPLLLALHAAPVAADPLADGVGAMPTAVEDVRVVGSFDVPGGGTGSYRVVIARSTAEPPVARLFVQWIGKGPDGAEVVQRSVEIKELETMKRDIDDYVAEPDDNGLSIFVELADSSGNGSDTYELFLNTDGTYTFGPASN